MKHYTSEQWGLYTGEQLSEEERMSYETHLSSCDSCLELYMQSLERAADSYPVLQDEAEFAEAIMGRIDLEPITAFPTPIPLIHLQQAKVRKSIAPAFTRNPVFHYMVAAVITIILMSSGAFQSLTERVGSLGTQTEATGGRGQQEQDPTQPKQATESTSVSYKLMEKTIVMLDSLQPKHERGGAR